jgi:ribonuclease BN (tRNA processing enzyme)
LSLNLHSFTRNLQSQVEETIEFAYSGDTTAAFFRAPTSARALHAQLLLTEATFLCNEVTAEHAPKRGHMHIDQIGDAARAGELEGLGALLLTHFSRRYSVGQINEALDTRLPPSIRARTTALILAGFHKDGSKATEEPDAVLARSDSF